MRKFGVLVATVVLGGCSFAVDVQRDAKAPQLPPSSYAEVVHRPPEPSEKLVHLARLEAQGNNWQDASDCEARLVLEARELGGNLVFAQPAEEGIGQGPLCVGEVYHLRK